MTGPASEPVTLAEVKDHLSVDGSEKDGLIAGYILAARREIEAYTRRVLVTQTWDYSIDRGWPGRYSGAYWRQRIELPIAPVVSVTTITYVDEGGTSRTLAADQYVLSSPGEVGVISPAYDVEWPDVRDQPNAITVRFVAGYAQVPDDIRVAVMLRTEQLHDRDPASESVLTSTWQALLGPHVVRRVL